MRAAMASRNSLGSRPPPRQGPRQACRWRRPSARLVGKEVRAERARRHGPASRRGGRGSRAGCKRDRAALERAAGGALKTSSSTQRMVKHRRAGVDPRHRRSQDLAHLAAGGLAARSSTVTSSPRAAELEGRRPAPPMPAPMITTRSPAKPPPHCNIPWPESHCLADIFMSILSLQCKVRQLILTVTTKRGRPAPWMPRCGSKQALAAVRRPCRGSRLPARASPPPSATPMFPGGARIRPQSLCLAVGRRLPGGRSPRSHRRRRRGDRALALRLPRPRRSALLRRRGDAARQALGPRARSASPWRCWRATRSSSSPSRPWRGRAAAHARSGSGGCSS